MCGICGKVNFNRQEIQEPPLREMCRSFFYRGPDDEGIYINNSNGNKKKNPINIGFGHQRLSIIDLSSGHQPMSNENCTIWITYNGEIYNFREIADELKRKGHRFKSNTDTEVLLHLYEEEGTHAVKRLNGMFAFAIWDENLKRLWVCRDRIGIKPVVYYWDGKHFIFASEIKALLADPIISKELDWEALQHYFAFNYVPAPLTIFKVIKKLEPGKYLILQDGKIEIKTYWEPPDSVDQDIASLPLDEQIEVFREPLYEGINDAVSSRMIADVPLGAFLSGGIDSSIIVALMARNSNAPIKTFSIGFKDDHLYDETHYAREVAQLYGTEHHEFKLSFKDMLDILPDVISTLDEPFADSSVIPTYIVSRETRKYVTVALSGDGGDELFAGYRSYLSEYWYNRYMQIPALFREGLIEKLIEVLPDSRDVKTLELIRRLKKFIKATKGSFPERLLSLKAVFPDEIRRRLLSNSYRNNNGQQDPALDWVSRLVNSYNGDRINTVLYTDFKDSLPGDMLAKVDRMSMRNSLEVRVPLLDHRVVELAFKMQGSLKLNKGKSKYILKHVFKDLLPPSLQNRPKAGFEVPISRWLKTDLKFLIDQYLAEDKIREQGIFDFQIIKDLIQKHLSNKTDTSWMLWNLIVFQCWYHKYLL
ncbi:MAG: asparagine synthase (glutamine-hydrolyzing) [Deltaproteobacteria bacterium]|jgi:asparagine synthase (glutamine-hydrolysing)|nr:asparagine synthase (glutamine-hydrolyzing) [Deltaproteobacteria bacterium]